MKNNSDQNSSAETAVLGKVGLALGAVLGLLGAGYYWLLKRPLPQTKGELALPGLHDRVEILRDRWGIPHIYAHDTHDLMFAQGFVHAQDRLWQMEFQRRLVSGRLSELVGEPTIQVDRWLRILGMRRVAEQGVALLNDEVRAYLEDYAAGVNARIARGRLPLEFTILRHRPEPWTLVDSLAWMKMLSWQLSVNWESELLRAQLIDRLGPERAAELEPGYLDRCPTIMPEGVDYSHIGEAALKRADETRPFMGPPSHAGLGSNNWVVTGRRTASGAPIFANDMHLLMTIPAVWYENHLVGGGLEVTGVSLPGIPGIVSGHNGRVAWGFTMGFDDVQDLYIERLRHTENGRVEYEYEGQWLEAGVVHEEIKVKGASPVVEQVIVTRHGPIINALIDGEAESPEEPPLALRWTSLEPEATVNTLVKTMSARNCHELHDALHEWVAPTVNVVSADVEGNIVYSHPGHVPVRARGDGTVPVPGWTADYEWLGYIPFAELPHLVNPPQEYIVTANNRIVGDDYPHFLTTEDMYGTDRAQRITELIRARDKIDITFTKIMQFDQVSVVARELQELLGQLDAGNDSELAAATALIRAWDCRITAESAAAALYEVFIQRMIYLSLADKLGDLTVRYAGKGPTPGLVLASVFGARSRMWLEETLKRPDSHWFDLGNGETRDDVMRLALRDAVAYLKKELGPSMDDWAWGKLHTLTYGHPLGQVKPLDRLFNRGPFPLGCDSSTVWQAMATYYDLSNPDIVGPPFRFVADLSDLRQSFGLLAPGQSGQPGSKHYDDQIEAWFNAGYHPIFFARADVERAAQDRLELRPG